MGRGAKLRGRGRGKGEKKEDIEGNGEKGQRIEEVKIWKGRGAMMRERGKGEWERVVTGGEGNRETGWKGGR